METITDWNGVPMLVGRSKGGVIAAAEPLRNLMRVDLAPWPPAEVVQKLYESRQSRAFAPPDLDCVTSTLGFYSDLQSLHSEDALTWSCFGPLIYGDSNCRKEFVEALFARLAIPSGPVADARLWLWRRIPHPDTRVPGGPEVDVGIQTETCLLFGEAKWLSGVGARQGVARDKDQIQLRREFFEKYGQRLYPSVRHFGVLGLSHLGDMIPTSLTRQLGGSGGALYMCDLRWEELVSLPHPRRDELKRYLEWKRSRSRLT